MSSPISPGDVVALAKGIYKMYRKFADAPEEMKQLSEKVKMVEVLLNHFKVPTNQLDYLKTAKGREMAELLQQLLRNLRTTLRQVKDVGKQWQKARQRWWRRAPFALYTMRCVPDLQTQLDEGLRDITMIRNVAHQEGVALGPTALKKIKAIAEEAAQRANAKTKTVAQSENDFNTVERKRRAACTALKKSAKLTKDSSSSSDSKIEAEIELRHSGLPEDEVKKLSEIYQQDLETAILESMLHGEDSRSRYSLKSAKSFQTGRTIAKPNIHVVQPKLQVLRPKPAKPQDNVKKAATVIGGLAAKDKQKGKPDDQGSALVPLSPKDKAKKRKNKDSNPSLKDEVKTPKDGKKQVNGPVVSNELVTGKKQGEKDVDKKIADAVPKNKQKSDSKDSKEVAKAKGPKVVKVEQDDKQSDFKKLKKDKPQDEKKLDKKKMEIKKDDKPQDKDKQDRQKKKDHKDTPSEQKDEAQPAASQKQDNKKANAKIDKKMPDQEGQENSNQEIEGEKKKKKKKGKAKAGDSKDDEMKNQVKQIKAASVISKTLVDGQGDGGEKKNVGKNGKKKDQAVKVVV